MALRQEFVNFAALLNWLISCLLPVASLLTMIKDLMGI